MKRILLLTLFAVPHVRTADTQKFRDFMKNEIIGVPGAIAAGVSGAWAGFYVPRAMSRPDRLNCAGKTGLAAFSCALLGMTYWKIHYYRKIPSQSHQ